jgi:hypothetical protein
VLDHSRPQTLAVHREHSEQRSIHRNRDHGLDALIAVRYSKKDGLQRHGCGIRAGNRMELLLQITTKDKFFADARRHGQNNPNDHF